MNYEVVAYVVVLGVIVVGLVVAVLTHSGGDGGAL